MKKMLLLVFTIFLFSCSITNKNAKYTQNFKEEFKFQAYCSCIVNGYEDKKITSKMIETDKSFYNPIINSVFSIELNKIGIEEAKIMKLDSLNSTKKVSEAKAGKQVLFHCLQFYNSKKLNIITKQKFKEWKNIKNIDSIVIIKVPAF